MKKWTAEDLALAIKLTSVQGYNFEEAAGILSRHTEINRTAAEVREKIEKDAPGDMRKILRAQKKRDQEQMLGRAAPAPRGRLGYTRDGLLNFVVHAERDLSEEALCWAARQAGHDCNLTDIRIAIKRARYRAVPDQNRGVPYYEAIIADAVCLWPLDDIRACGRPREVGAYCGPHFCRSIGHRED